MTQNPEQNQGAGETDQPSADRTELLDFLAKEGLRNILLTISHLRTIGADHPMEYPYIPARVFVLEQISARIEAGLSEAGYANHDVNRPAVSIIQPPEADPAKPGANH